MNTRSLKRRWLKTKIALNDTVQKILEINRKRKQLSAFTKERNGREEELNDELKMLNALADQQARLMRRYEEKITDEEPVPLSQ